MPESINTPSFVYGFQGQNFYTPPAPLQQQIAEVCKGLLAYEPFQQMVLARGLDFQRIEQITGSFVPNQRLLLTIRIGSHYYPFLMEREIADEQVILAAAFLANPQSGLFPTFAELSTAPRPQTIPHDRAPAPAEPDSNDTDPDATGVYEFASHSDTPSEPDAPLLPRRVPPRRAATSDSDSPSDGSAHSPRAPDAPVRPPRDPRRVRFDVPESDSDSPRHSDGSGDAPFVQELSDEEDLNRVPNRNNRVPRARPAHHIAPPNSDTESSSEEEQPQFPAQPQGIPAGRLPRQALNVPAAPQDAPRGNPPAGQFPIDAIENALQREREAREELQRRLIANEAEMHRLVQHINGPMNQRLQDFQHLMEQRNRQVAQEAYQAIIDRLTQQRQELLQALDRINQNVARIEAESVARQNEAHDQNQQRLQQLQDAIQAHEARIQQLQNNPQFQQALAEAEQRREGLEQQLNELRERFNQLPVQQYQNAFRDAQARHEAVAHQVEELQGRFDAFNQRIDNLAQAQQQQGAAANQMEQRLNELPGQYQAAIDAAVDQGRQAHAHINGQFDAMGQLIHGLAQAQQQQGAAVHQIQDRLNGLPAEYQAAIDAAMAQEREAHQEMANQVAAIEERINQLIQSQQQQDNFAQQLAHLLNASRAELRQLLQEQEQRVNRRIDLSSQGFNQRMDQLNAAFRHQRGQIDRHIHHLLERMNELERQMGEMNQRPANQPLPFPFRPFPFMAANFPRREAPALPAGAPNAQPAAAPQPFSLQQRWNGPHRPSFDELDIGRFAGGVFNLIRRAPK